MRCPEERIRRLLSKLDRVAALSSKPERIGERIEEASTVPDRRRAGDQTRGIKRSVEFVSNDSECGV